jgi:hypothetical protein
MIDISAKAINAELRARAEESLKRLEESRPETAANVVQAGADLTALLALAFDEQREGGDALIIQLAASLLERSGRETSELAVMFAEESRLRAV